jgi:hypothetical protein
MGPGQSFSPVWEKAGKKRGWETDLGEDEHDGLKDDKKPIENCPERACRLVRYSAFPE